MIFRRDIFLINYPIEIYKVSYRIADTVKFGSAMERKSPPPNDLAPKFETYVVDFIEWIHQLPNLK